jgi:hypothetical protein
VNAARRARLAGAVCTGTKAPLGTERRERTLNGVRKGRVEVVDDLGEACRGLLVASFIQHEDLDIPGLHGVALHFRWLVTAGQKVSIGERDIVALVATGKREGEGIVGDVAHVSLFRDELHGSFDLHKVSKVNSTRLEPLPPPIFGKL